MVGSHFCQFFAPTRQKPAYGQQGLDWDRRFVVGGGVSQVTLMTHLEKVIIFVTDTFRRQRGVPKDLLDI